MLGGGCSGSIPLRAFQKLGYEKNVVILVRPAEYRKKPELRGLIRLFYKNYPKFAAELENRAEDITERRRKSYTAKGGEGMIAFASSFPGSIVQFEIAQGKEMIVQKSGFLASESTVELSVHMQKKLGAGFFGGEGFIM